MSTRTQTKPPLGGRPTLPEAEFRTSTTSPILAIDPGFDRVGVAVMGGISGKEELVFSSCLVTHKKDSQEKRLLSIGTEIKGVIKKFKPKALAIEKLFFNQNITSALKVAEARGVILYEAASENIPVFEYSPQEIKIAVTGYGKASKDSVQNMTRRLVHLESKKRLDDEIDAIAIGITHLASVKYKSKLSTE